MNELLFSGARRRSLPLLVLSASFAAAAQLALGVHAADAQSLTYSRGQNISPAYEGWEIDADGSRHFLFGYMNRNWEEEIDVPVGPDNGFAPGSADQGQPTRFLPRRNRFVFRIPVPKAFTEKDELIWTLTTYGKSEKAYATLRPDYLVDDVVRASETGALGAYAVKQTPDGGYIVAGESSSTDGNVTGNHGSSDYWVVKLNFDGKIEWEKSLGGSSLDRANDIHLTHDGGYIVFGMSYSVDGDVIGNHGTFDFWVAKLSKTGDLEWQKALGGSIEEFPRTMALTNDNGYVLTGLASSTNGDVIGNDGGADLWVVKLSEMGDLDWQKTYGGTKAELGSSIQQTSDGGYIVAGYSWSNDGDVSVNQGKTDFWVVKLSPESSPTSEVQASTLQIYPNPATSTISISPAEVLTEEGTSSETQLAIQITNLLGQQLHHQTTPTNQPINISTLPNGLYLLSATTPAGIVFSGKFSKQD